MMMNVESSVIREDAASAWVDFLAFLNMNGSSHKLTFVPGACRNIFSSVWKKV